MVYAVQLQLSHILLLLESCLCLHSARFATGLSDALHVQETNQLLEGMSSSMGFIEALSSHLHGHAWAYPDDHMPPSIQPAAAQTLYDVAAELQGSQQAEGGRADGSLPAPFRCLLSLLASGNDWAVGMGQSWLLQLLLVHAEVAIAGQLKPSMPSLSFMPSGTSFVQGLVRSYVKAQASQASVSLIHA